LPNTLWRERGSFAKKTENFMDLELHSLSEYVSDCLNDAVPLAYRSGIPITDVAELVEYFNGIKLPKEEEVAKILKEAEAGLPAVRAFLHAIEELSEAGLSLAGFAATVDVQPSRYIFGHFRVYQRMGEFDHFVARRSPVNPRHQLIAAMMAGALNLWLDYSEVPADFSFMETEDGLVPKPGSALAFIMDAIGHIHKISVEEYRAALPLMEQMVGENLVFPLESQATVGSEPA